MNKVSSQIEKIRLQLLDLGLRGNTLLHFSPRGSKHIAVIDEKSTSVFDLLATQGKSMAFLPRPEVYDAEEELPDAGELPEDYEKLPPLQEYLAVAKGDKRFEDLNLQTSLSASNLDLHLLKIDSEAKAFFQERGFDALYLSLGFLTWFEDEQSDKKRYAPLILLPVELNRESASSGFKIKYTGMDVTANETLYAKLKNDFKIQLPPLEDFLKEEAALKSYFESISDAIKNQPRWGVEFDKIELGFFSFGKFQMYKDLDPKIWPENASLEERPMLKTLFDTGFQMDGELLNSENSPEILDALKQPELLHLIKDADSTQIEAILGVLKGASLVIQGPPGTGKSQTISNLIAEALAQNKKILFVAQKLTALEVVKRRLDESNLGDAVLELHSHKSHPRAVLNSLDETLRRDCPETPDRYPAINVRIRNRKGLPSGERSLDFVAPQEIQKGILDVVDESLSISPADCFSEVSSRLGFQRVTEQMSQIFRKQLMSLVTAGKICFTDERLSLAKK